ncbi:hypothetical protein VTL71DRAFT_9902 [Oculimacula yallundae]|uniref:Heterokaryon incompatibility domain-containing protein n=1 Tax=Oculimacula yallundae TaxID=86028 RepID=A0ABR4BQX3_9HELO
MCFSREPHVRHNCAATCPICWVLTERNVIRLMDGESLTVGTSFDFVKTMLAGCMLCASIVRYIDSRDDKKEISSDAIATIKGKPSDESNPTDLKHLRITFTNPAVVMTESTLFPGLGHTPGADQEGEDDTPRMYSNVFAFWLEGGLYTRGGPAELYIKQNAASPSVSSGESFATARRWIAECQSSHSNCPSSEPRALPTRVLDVSRQLGEGNIKLVETGGMVGQYVALSYCWGRTLQRRTMIATLEGHKQNIPVRGLPKTICDAITVTRELGIRYLWIDSLCIIQDSSEDKAKEISKMSNIYREAAVTISAAITSDCGQGFLHDRAEVIERLQGSFQLPFLFESGQEAEDVFFCTDSSMGYGIKDFVSKEVIETRAWTLQESWLSPRLLIYGTGPVQWRCLSRESTHGLDTTDSIDFVSSIRSGCYNDRGKFLKEPTATAGSTMPTMLNEARDRQQRWQSIAQNYQSRQLTVATDKLPALSGIATIFHHLSKDTYLAGLWESELPCGLLWHCRVAIQAKPFEGQSISFANNQSRQFQPNSIGARHEPRMIGEGGSGEASSSKTRFTTETTSQEDLTTSESARSGGSLSSIVAKPPTNSAQTPMFFDSGAMLASLGYHLRSLAHEYIAPSWSFTSVRGSLSFAFHLWDNPHSKVTIHSASTNPVYPVAPFAEVDAGHITLTGPMRRMTFEEIDSRFVLCIDEEPHIFWDYIIPDGGSKNKYINMASKNTNLSRFVEWDNPQYPMKRKITQPIMDYMLVAQPEASNCRPTPLVGAMSDLGAETPDFWLLEITWTDVPKGLLLVRRDDAMFERVGFFKMARHTWEAADWRTRGSEWAGPRDWDWYGELRMYTITIV